MWISWLLNLLRKHYCLYLMKSIKSAGSASYSTGDITIFKAQKMYPKDVFSKHWALQINHEMLLTLQYRTWFQDSLLATKPRKCWQQGAHAVASLTSEDSPQRTDLILAQTLHFYCNSDNTGNNSTKYSPFNTVYCLEWCLLNSELKCTGECQVVLARAFESDLVPTLVRGLFPVRRAYI